MNLSENPSHNNLIIHIHAIRFDDANEHNFIEVLRILEKSR